MIAICDRDSYLLFNVICFFKMELCAFRGAPKLLLFCSVVNVCLRALPLSRPLIPTFSYADVNTI